ncbi:MAG: glycosyltransferase family 4 protein [Myxococcota bacterium]|nr:glycosyltransferase family 4 protein [Myxococcota bacterium]
MSGSKLKILVAQHRWWYPTYVSGADLANHEFARCLRERGFDLRVHGICPPGTSSRLSGRSYVVDGVPVSLVNGNFLDSLDATLLDFRPDVVLTSCPEPSATADDVQDMVEHIARAGAPVVLYVHELTATLPMFEKARQHLSAVVTNSHFMAGVISERWECECHVVYPVPDWRSFHTEEEGGPYITFFNPAPHKGLEIAHTLVTRVFPDRPFLFVEGFLDPEARGIALYRSGNLVHARSSPDVATIYGMTRTVIVPSQWQEPFGRIVLEAMYCGIPVIASRTGGLAESVGKGGILVDDFTDVTSWTQAIVTLDDTKQRRKWIDAGRAHVSRFRLDDEISLLERVLQMACSRRRVSAN